MADDVKEIPDLTGVRILVAEDDEYSLQMLELILADTKAEIIIARDGKEALDLFGSRDVNLAILDIRLPVLDGLQVLSEMLKINPGIFVIAQSAYALDSDREKGLKAGFRHYITKPVDAKTLLNAINDYKLSGLSPGSLKKTHQEAEKKFDKRGFKKLCDTIPEYVVMLDYNYRVTFVNKVFRERLGDLAGNVYTEYMSHLNTKALRERTEDLNLAQSVGHIGSWRLKIATNELIWSRETYRIFEVPVNESLTYDKFLSFVHPGDRDFVNSKWNNALKGDGYNIEHRILVNGRVKWVSERAILETDQDNKLVSGFGVVQDITELRQTTEKLQKSEEELRLRNDNLTRINTMLEDFVSIAAHDLRSPVASMKTLSGLIEIIPDMSRRMKLFEELMQIVNRLERTVEGLVETVNIQRKDDIPSKKLNVNSVLDVVLSGISEMIQEKRAEIIHSISSDTTIIYVEAYLHSIFSNLISNAIKYSSPERTPVLKINNFRADEYFILRFSDNGIGIDLEKAGNNMFRPFKRFTDIASGTGMGLYLIKNILEKNGGYIEVSSAPDQGTTFTCYLKEYKEAE